MSAVAAQEPQPFNTATWLKDSVAAIAAAAVSALGAGSEGFAPWGFVLVVIAGVVPIVQRRFPYFTVAGLLVALCVSALQPQPSVGVIVLVCMCAYISMRRVKTSAIVVLMAVMQLVFIVCALALGFVLGVRRLPPTVLHPLC